MEEPREEIEEEEQEEHEAGDSKMRWMLTKGWGIGKKMMITGAVISSAPIVLPPLLIFSTIGFAFSVPFGLYFASYACTDKLMSKLLSTPSPNDDTVLFTDSAIVEEPPQIFKEDQLDQKYEEGGAAMQEDHHVEPVEEEKKEEMDDSAEKKEYEVKPVEDEQVSEVSIERIDDQSYKTNLGEKKETELEHSAEEEEKQRRESNGVRVESRGVEEGTDVNEKEEEKSVNQNMINTEKGGLERETNGMKEVSDDEDGQNAEHEVEIDIDEEKGNIVDDEAKPIREVIIDDIEKEEKIEGKNEEYVNGSKEENSVEEIEVAGNEKDGGGSMEEKAIPVHGKVDKAIEDGNGSLTVDEEPIGATPNERDDNIREIADESGLHLVDEKVAGTDESHEVKESQATINDDVKVAPADLEPNSSKEIIVVYTEEKTWEKIDALRKIVGYKAAAKESCMEEVKALYLFTGVEPPTAFKDPTDFVEVNDKLKLLMSIVGVK